MPPCSHSRYVLWSLCFRFRCCNSYLFCCNSTFFYLLQWNMFLPVHREIHWKVLSSKTCHSQYSLLLLYLHNDKKTRHVHHHYQVLRLKTWVRWLHNSLPRVGGYVLSLQARLSVTRGQILLKNSVCGQVPKSLEQSNSPDEKGLREWF